MVRAFKVITALAASFVLLAAKICCAGQLATPAAGALTPLDFSTLIPVETPVRAPIYSLDLPFAVYRHSQSSPLRDVRVFNSLGRAQPFLITPAVEKQAVEQERAYACFEQSAGLTRRDQVVLLRRGGIAPQPADETSPGDTDEIRRVAQGVLVDFGREHPSFSRIRVLPAATTPAAAAGPDVRGSADGEESQPPPELHNGQRGDVISVQVYVSRDLKRWRQVESRLPLGRLEMRGQPLEMLDLPAEAVTARYLLLLPAADAKLFAIREVLTRERAAAVAITQKTRLSGRWDPAERAYGFDLPRSLPVLDLQPLLNSENHLLRAQLLTRGPQTPAPALRDSRKRNTRPSSETVWQVRDNLLLYALHIKHSAQTNAPVPFEQRWLHPESNDPALSRNPTLLLRPQSGREWPQPPTLEVRWASRRLYFLAEGPGPYILAVGSARAAEPAQEAALRDLSGQAVAAHLRLEEAITQTPAPTGPADSGAQRRLLWAILLSGALFMAFMAVRLLRQSKV